MDYSLFLLYFLPLYPELSLALRKKFSYLDHSGIEIEGICN